MKYLPYYKCQLCGAYVSTGTPVEIPYDELPRLLGEIIKNQQMIGSPHLYKAPMHIPHKCSDGSAGLAVFSGFKLQK